MKTPRGYAAREGCCLKLSALSPPEIIGYVVIVSHKEHKETQRFCGLCDLCGSLDSIAWAIGSTQRARSASTVAVEKNARPSEEGRARCAGLTKRKGYLHPSLFTFHLSPFTFHFPFSTFTFHLSFFIFHFSFSIFHFPLFTFHLSPFTFHFSFSTFHFSPFTFHFSFFIFHFSFFIFTRSPSARCQPSC